MPMPSAIASCGGWMSARLAVDEDLAAVGCVEAVGDAHRRRLAGAVLADDGVNRPGSTMMLTWSLARTSPKRLVMSRSSSMRSLLRHRVRHLDLARR